MLDNNIVLLYNKIIPKPQINMKGLDKMLNNVMLMGRLTANPEMKTTAESHYCKFCLAVQRSKRKGEETAETDFFNCIAWNKNADVVCDWYGKGDMMMLVGTLRNHRYEKNGENRIATEIVVREIHFTGRKKASDENTELDFSYSPDEFEEIFTDEDVPF